MAATLNSMEALLKRLAGIKDSRGPVGIYSRGANVYPRGSHAHSGGGYQYGRPRKTAIQRRMRRK